MTTKSAALAAALLVGLASSAGAQNADVEYRRYCTGDYQRLCSAYSPGSTEVEQCFKARFRELSQYCQATINKYGGGGRRR